MERVCANYSELNEPINRESFGPLTATLVPPVHHYRDPAAGNAASSLEEGREVVLRVVRAAGIDEPGYRHRRGDSQEMAQTLRRGDRLRMTAAINLVYHQWMGAFPTNQDLCGPADQPLHGHRVDGGRGQDHHQDPAGGDRHSHPSEANAKTVADTQYCLQDTEWIAARGGRGRRRGDADPGGAGDHGGGASTTPPTPCGARCFNSIKKRRHRCAVFTAYHQPE